MRRRQQINQSDFNIRSLESQAEAAGILFQSRPMIIQHLIELENRFPDVFVRNYLQWHVSKLFSLIKENAKFHVDVLDARNRIEESIITGWMLESEKLKQDAVLQTGKDHAHLDLVNDNAARDVLKRMDEESKARQSELERFDAKVEKMGLVGPIDRGAAQSFSGIEEEADTEFKELTSKQQIFSRNVQPFSDAERNPRKIILGDTQVQEVAPPKPVLGPFESPFEQAELAAHKHPQTPKSKQQPKWITSIEDVAKLEVDEAVKSQQTVEEESKEEVKGEVVKMNIIDFETATMQSTGQKQMSKAEVGDIIDRVLTQHLNAPSMKSKDARFWGDLYPEIASRVYTATIDKASNLNYETPVKSNFADIIRDFNKQNKDGTSQQRIELLKTLLMTKFIKVNDPPIAESKNIPKEA